MDNDARMLGGLDSDNGPTPLLTIGYGDKRTTDEFFELLRRNGVRYLIDVRTRPYSKFRPEFSRGALEITARKSGIKYVFMGDSLGGLPSDPSCYVGGRVVYDIVRERDWFRGGLDRLEKGCRAGYRLAIMCAELAPEKCHRSKLIGVELAGRGVGVYHIDENGRVVGQKEVLDRLNCGQLTLTKEQGTSRRKYSAGSAPKERLHD